MLLHKKTEGFRAFGDTDLQHNNAQRMRNACKPPPIRTIPSAPAFHRILLATRQARGLGGSVTSHRPPYRRSGIISHLVRFTLPRRFPIFNYRYYI